MPMTINDLLPYLSCAAIGGIISLLFRIKTFRHRVDQVEFEATKEGYSFYTAELIKLTEQWKASSDLVLKSQRMSAQMYTRIQALESALELCDPEHELVKNKFQYDQE